MAALGGALEAALRLGIAMTLLQFAIGALNDLVDRDRDAGSRPEKPIPAGVVSVPLARAVVVVSAGAGLWLAATVGPATLALAVLGLATGILYDLRFRGGAWSWLPFPIGLALLLAFAAAGAAASGGAPGPTVVALIALSLPGGAGLAVANALPDVEADRRAGEGSVATALGPGRARRLGGLFVLGPVLVIDLALVAALRSAASGGPLPAPAPAAAGLAIAGSGCVAVGLLLGRPGPADRRRRAWEAQGLGLALLAVAAILLRPLDG